MVCLPSLKLINDRKRTDHLFDKDKDDQISEYQHRDEQVTIDNDSISHSWRCHIKLSPNPELKAMTKIQPSEGFAMAGMIYNKLLIYPFWRKDTKELQQFPSIVCDIVENVI